MIGNVHKISGNNFLIVEQVVYLNTFDHNETGHELL